MSALARPGPLAALLALAGLALHPSPLIVRLLPAPDLLIAALLTLLALALVARAAAARDGRLGAACSAAGAVLVVAGLAADGVLGHQGTLALAVGQTATAFEETGRGGAELGLRPLGFPVEAERVEPGRVALMLPEREEPVVLSGERALWAFGYRLARPDVVEPGKLVEVAVHREPAAAVVLTGALLLAFGSALLVPVRRAAEEGRAAPLVVPGGALLFALAFSDHGAALGWSYGIVTSGGRVPVAGAGVCLGLALVATLLGTLLLAAQELGGGATAAAVPARAALGLGVALAVPGIGLAALQVARSSGASPLPLVALASAAALVALALSWTRGSDVPGGRAAALVWPAAVVGALGLALFVAVEGLQREGTYATAAAAAAASAALLGLAAVEPTRLAPALRLGFLIALVSLAL